MTQYVSQIETRLRTILIIKRVRVIFSHTDAGLTAKTLFVCFDFVFAAVFTLSTTRTTTAAATEFTQVAAMAAPCKFLIHSKLTTLQASYTPATLCDWCVVSYCCRLLCELRYRCVQPTVLCYGRESSTQQQYTAACRAQQWANTTEEVDGEPTATANTFYSSK